MIDFYAGNLHTVRHIEFNLKDSVLDFRSKSVRNGSSYFYESCRTSTCSCPHLRKWRAIRCTLLLSEPDSYQYTSFKESHSASSCITEKLTAISNVSVYMQVYIPTLCQQTGCEWVYQMNGCPNTFPCRVSIHTFHNTESRATIIYDWRAPISSMFYDHELSNRTRNEHGADFATITLKHSTSSLFNTILITILLVAYVLVLYLHPRGYIHRSSKSSFCTDSRMLTFIAYIIT